MIPIQNLLPGIGHTLNIDMFYCVLLSVADLK